MNEAQPRRLDLSLESASPLPSPGAAQLHVEHPPDSVAPLWSSNPPAGTGRRFEQPSSWHVGETAQQVWESARDQASALAGTLSHRAQIMGTDMTRWIRRNPATALLCGFGVGFLLADAVIFARSRSR
jgi:hypothetical protein